MYTCMCGTYVHARMYVCVRERMHGISACAQVRVNVCVCVIYV